MLKSNFTGETMVFRKDRDGRPPLYSTSIGKKNQDGTYTDGYIGLQFKKGVDIQNKTKVNVTNGWLTFYMSKTEPPRPVWGIFVNEFEFESVADNFEQLDEQVPF